MNYNYIVRAIMLRSGLFVNFSGILITAVISSASYSSDPFPRPNDSFRNEPDFLRDNRDHNDSSTLAPFQNNLSSSPSSTSPTPQPPSPPSVPQRRIQNQK